MATATIAKGSEEERKTWKKWAKDVGLMDRHDNFRFTCTNERRRVFRSELDKKTLDSLKIMERCMINLVHFINAVTERWPDTIRVLLNNENVSGGECGPFESWYGDDGLERRKQSTRVWTDLIQFLALEYHYNNVTWSGDTISLRGTHGYLSDSGFLISEDFGDDILDIIQGPWYGIEHIKDAINSFCLNIIMHQDATWNTNPLLFWVALLLQTEEFGDQPRLEFGDLRDELTMREKLEALVHYARVFIIDHAFTTWQLSDSVPQEWKKAVQTEVNSEMRRSDAKNKGDPADFDQPHWQSFKDHFDGFRVKWLTKDSTTPIGVILGLL